MGTLSSSPKPQTILRELFGIPSTAPPTAPKIFADVSQNTSGGGGGSHFGTPSTLDQPKKNQKNEEFTKGMSPKERSRTVSLQIQSSTKILLKQFDRLNQYLNERKEELFVTP